jgi:hypothetical protein
VSGSFLENELLLFPAKSIINFFVNFSLNLSTIEFLFFLSLLFEFYRVLEFPALFSFIILVGLFINELYSNGFAYFS